MMAVEVVTLYKLSELCLELETAEVVVIYHQDHHLIHSQTQLLIQIQTHYLIHSQTQLLIQIQIQMMAAEEETEMEMAAEEVEMQLEEEQHQAHQVEYSCVLYVPQETISIIKRETNSQ